MRILGVIFIVSGLLACLTIIGIPFGIFLIIVGIVCVAVGGRRNTVITNVVQVSNTPGLQQAQIPLGADVPINRLRTIDAPSYDARLIERERPAPQSARRFEPPIVDQPAEEATRGRYSYDRKKWDALVEFDDDIGRVAKALQPYGDKYIDQFAAAYLALNDKQYLPAIVQKILETAKQDGAARPR